MTDRSVIRMIFKKPFMSERSVKVKTEFFNKQIFLKISFPLHRKDLLYFLNNYIIPRPGSRINLGTSAGSGTRCTDPHAYCTCSGT